MDETSKVIMLYMEKGIQIQNELLQCRHTIPFPYYTATIFVMETKVKFILVIKKEFSCMTCKISLKFLPSLPVFQTTPTYFLLLPESVFQVL